MRVIFTGFKMVCSTEELKASVQRKEAKIFKEDFEQPTVNSFETKVTVLTVSQCSEGMFNSEIRNFPYLNVLGHFLSFFAKPRTMAFGSRPPLITFAVWTGLRTELDLHRFKCAAEAWRLERLRFTLTTNGKRESVPRDQVFPLIVDKCLLLQLKNK